MPLQVDLLGGGPDPANPYPPQAPVGSPLSPTPQRRQRPQPLGIVTPATVDPLDPNRPRVPLPGGGYETMRTITITDDRGRGILIPTVYDGRAHTPEEAKVHFRQTGQHFGIFQNESAATAYDRALHQYIEPGSYERGAGLPSTAAQPTPAKPQQPTKLQVDVLPNPIDQLRTPAMRQRVARIAAAKKVPWQQIESELAQTATETGRPVDLIVASMEQMLPKAPTPLSTAQHAALDLAGATGGAINSVLNYDLEKPLRWGLGILGKPAEIVEHDLTSGRGYKIWLREQEANLKRMGIPVEPMTEQQLNIASMGLKVILDPTNVLMFPRGVSRVLTLAGKAGEVTNRVARATGVSDFVANAAGVTAQRLFAGPAGPPTLATLGFLLRTGERLQQGSVNLRRAFDMAANLPPAARRAARIYVTNQAMVGRNAAVLLDRLFQEFPVESDRAELIHVLEGTKPLGTLPPQLAQKFLQVIRPISDGQTDRAVLGGFISHAIDNYVKHLWPGWEIAQKISRRGVAPSEFKVGARQMLPGQGLSTTVPSAAHRTYPTVADAIADGRQPIVDVARSLAAKELETGMAENNQALIQEFTELGPDWVRAKGNAPAGWVDGDKLLGETTARRTLVRPGAVQGAARVSHVAFHPSIADYALEHMENPVIPQWLKNLHTGTGVVKSIIFKAPLFHGANIWRSAFLADGLRVFHPSNYARWKAAAQDAREGGPRSQAFLAAGGSMDSSAMRVIKSTMHDILTKDPAAAALNQSGLSWRDLFHPVTLAKHLLEAGERFVWDTLDKGARIDIFERLQQIQRMGPEEAAKMTNLVLNDYSKTGLTRLERELTNVFFTYSWQKGRMRLFGNMARTFSPWSDLTTYERQFLERVTQRWAMANIVMPHIVRAMQGRASAGFFGSKIQIGTVQSPTGIPRPLYISPFGFFNDGIEAVTHPGVYTLGRVGPVVQLMADLLTASRTARLTGQTTGQVMRRTVQATAPDIAPAGVTSGIRGLRGRTQIDVGPVHLRGLAAGLIASGLPFAGIPEYTTPPDPEDPNSALQDAMVNHDYMKAALIIRQNQLNFSRLAANLPIDTRRQLEKAYNLLAPHIRGPKLPGLRTRP